ncbi:GYF domain-containing protein [Schizosaccharomyces cryophilus OY26]|uniref:GYF domain-containing protein n=1 Tax=Schizosaccharomyces cryophilus (strain OY26 / ATCC MYA-4695 / CBS 11777 / NBRC 106824 / NRRL Y48691) TaxID=653667 RepID=S9W3F7_SCHCR|nr:GYF domain-containing protein [Schizosaccharomyces cryophilus OY26]EPY52475.1 GYF domain-containing protein [Schizosaccharomyces cryophilus OY26]
MNSEASVFSNMDWSQLANSLNKKESQPTLSSNNNMYPQLSSYMNPTGANGVGSPANLHVDPTVAAASEAHRKLSLKSGNLWDSYGVSSSTPTMPSFSSNISNPTSSGHNVSSVNNNNVSEKGPVLASTASSMPTAASNTSATDPMASYPNSTSIGGNPLGSMDSNSGFFPPKSYASPFPNALATEGMSPKFLKDRFPSSNSVAGTGSPRVGSPFTSFTRASLNASPSTTSLPQSRSVGSSINNPSAYGWLPQQPNSIPAAYAANTSQVDADPALAQFSSAGHAYDSPSNATTLGTSNLNGTSGYQQFAGNSQPEALPETINSPMRRGSARLSNSPVYPIGASMSARDVDSPLNILVDKAKAKISMNDNGASTNSVRAQSIPNQTASNFFPPENFPQHLASLIPPAVLRWLYKDPQNNIQGPFSGVDMHQWYRAGYFPLSLPVKRLEEEEYYSLAFFIRQVGNQLEPFLVPLSPVSVQNNQNPSWNAQGTDLPSSTYIPNGENETSEKGDMRDRKESLQLQHEGIPAKASTQPQSQSLVETMVNQRDDGNSKEEQQVATSSSNIMKEGEVKDTNNEQLAGQVKEKEYNLLDQTAVDSDLTRDLKSLELKEKHSKDEAKNRAELAQKVGEPQFVHNKAEPPASELGTTTPRPSPWKPLPSKPMPSLDETIHKEMENALNSESPGKNEKVNQKPVNIQPSVPAEAGSPWAKVNDVATSISQEIQRMEKQNETLKTKTAAQAQTQTQAQAQAENVAATVKPAPQTLASTSVWGSGSVNPPNAWSKHAALKSPMLKKNIQQAEANAKQQPSVNTTTTAAAVANVTNARNVTPAAKVKPTASVPAPSVPNEENKKISAFLETAIESEDSWSVVGPGGKVVNQQPPATTAGNRSPSSKPSVVTAAPTSQNNTSKLQQVISSSGLSPEFLSWCKISLKGLNEGVNYEEFLSMLLSFPVESNTEVAEIISDSIYANSTTMDGRRFAGEFMRRRMADLSGKDEGLTGMITKGQENGSFGAWSQVARTKPKQGTEWNSAFKVVTGKKNKKRS